MTILERMLSRVKPTTGNFSEYEKLFFSGTPVQVLPGNIHGKCISQQGLKEAWASKAWATSGISSSSDVLANPCFKQMVVDHEKEI